MPKTPLDAAKLLAALLRELNSEGFLFSGILKIRRGTAYAYVEAAADKTLQYQEVSDT